MPPDVPAVPAAVTETATAALGALIVGGAHGSLAIARSLGRRGIPVWFLTHDHPLARFSRYVSRTLHWSGPDHPGAADTLLQLARTHRLDGWVLFAGGDAEVRLISQHHAALAAVYRVTSPPWEIARVAYDKRLTHQRAAELGLAVPWSAYPRDREDVETLDCRFPVILKPTVRERRNAFTLAKAWRVDDRAALVARYAEAAALVGERAIVLQELIPGGGERQFSFAALCERGEPLLSLVARRSRQYPIDFGYTSTFVEIVERPEVEEAARRILRSLDYSGLVEIEFKHDARDGGYKILDINARAWTWVGLGRIAGTDFPYAAWQLARGESVTPARGRPGAAWMHVARDLVAAVQERLAGVRSPISYLHVVGRPLVFAAFALDDPLPGIVELPVVGLRVLTRRIPDMLRAAWKTHVARPAGDPVG
jgi:D-aspartate ligase